MIHFYVDIVRIGFVKRAHQLIYVYHLMVKCEEVAAPRVQLGGNGAARSAHNCDARRGDAHLQQGQPHSNKDLVLSHKVAWLVEDEAERGIHHR